MKSVSYLGIMAGILFSISLPVIAGTGDYDGDGDVDLIDYTDFNFYATGPGGVTTPEGQIGDFDIDGDVDLYDFGCFASAFNHSKNNRQKASTFTMNLAATSSTTVNPGDTVHYSITGQFTGGSSLGLGLWGVNLSSDFGLSGELAKASPGPEMDGFVKNSGFTNPDGYGGTDDGNGGLWQIGGGQNTIGNTGPVFYPTGVTELGIGLTEIVLATGFVIVPDKGGDFTLSLDTPFGTSILSNSAWSQEVEMMSAQLGTASIDITVTPEPTALCMLVFGSLAINMRRR